MFNWCEKALTKHCSMFMYCIINGLEKIRPIFDLHKSQIKSLTIVGQIKRNCINQN